MPPSESEVLAARLTRIKLLIDALESACSESVEQRELFRKIKAEMKAARGTLTLVPPPG
jgi:hypothetical protein